MTASASSSCPGRPPSKSSSAATSRASPARMAGSTGASAATEGSGCERNFQSSTSGKDVFYVRDQDSLGPGRHRLCDRPAGDLERDGVDGLAPWLPVPARPSLVRVTAFPVLPPAGLLLVVVCLRRLRARHLHRGR